MVWWHHVLVKLIGSNHFTQGKLRAGSVAKMRGDGGVEGIREEGFVVHSVGLKAQVSEMVENITGGVGAKFCSGEVRVQGEVTEVGGDGGI